jgi:succinyl-CoA synthetase beta subunit/citryl-CoA synthetase large subunit
VTGRALNRLDADPAPRWRSCSSMRHDAGRDQPAGELEDGSFVALDAHMDMENEARGRQKDLLDALGVGDEETRQAREPTPFELGRRGGRRQDHRGVAGNVTEFDGDLGLVIGAGGGSLTPLRRRCAPTAAGRPNYCEIGGNPSVAKAAGLAKLVLPEAGVDKIAGDDVDRLQHRVDIVARGVDQGMLELGTRTRPRRSRSSASPGRGRRRASRSSSATASDYADRSVSLQRGRAARGERSGRRG